MGWHTDILKRIARKGGPVLLLVLLGGCAAQLQSPLLDLSLSYGPSFPGGEQSIPVVYPYEDRQEASDGPLVEAYGPAWRDLRGSYPEYQFN